MSPAATTPAPSPWWRSAVTYQLYVRSFADSNSDGIGDLAGVIDRLDHLSDLGVDALWLTPCYPSPQLDTGYDVADYFDIEPDYGDLETFDRLIAAARRRGIKVLMDVVPNHCSSRHAWFQAALAADPGSPERERFFFRDGRGEGGDEPPNNWRSVFGGRTWTRTVDSDGSPGQWYLHTFAPSQPDFNWESPDVVNHFDDMLRFWFDRGVEGFRVDAIAVAGKAPGLPDAPPVPSDVAENDVWSHNPYTVFWPSAHDHWKHWRAVIDRYELDHPGRSLVTVSEAYTPGRPDLLLKFIGPDEFHQSFCFDIMLTPWNAPMMRDTLASFISVLTAAGAALTWTLNNHDTQRAVTRYGRANAAEPSSWTGNNLVYIDAPIDLDVGARRARAMITMMAALPGALYLFQGEELGLPEVFDIPDDRRQDPIFERTEGREIGRDGCRIPMPWTDDPVTAFGFSTPVGAAHVRGANQAGDTATGAAREPWLPQPTDWGQRSAETQRGDTRSALSLYRELLAGRADIVESAELEWLLGNDDELLAFRRGDLSVVLNVAPYDVDITDVVGDDMRVAMCSVAGHDDSSTVPGDACVWLRPGP